MDHVCKEMWAKTSSFAFVRLGCGKEHNSTVHSGQTSSAPGSDPAQAPDLQPPPSCARAKQLRGEMCDKFLGNAVINELFLSRVFVESSSYNKNYRGGVGHLVL